VKIINLEKSDESWLKIEDFLKYAGNSLKSFRYYDKRGRLDFNRHIYTVLLVDKKSEKVGYGHLDLCEKNKVWLGICLIEKFKGKGYGKLIMENLLNYADQKKLEVNLSVDKNNTIGVKLYVKFGFKHYNNSTNMFFMKRRVNNV
jgi:ribosomal protein S18 acetylase RimI-like enzyme